MSFGPEMINELKRLSSVVTSLSGVIAELQTSNTNLTSMIAQQLITNNNLANSIIELQNQVAQQTVTNVNLTNMIAELQTSVATLTTITGQLVTVNIRALDGGDLAHEGMPYNYKGVVTANITNIADCGDELIQFDQTDWGVGLNYYVRTIAMWALFENGGFTRYHNALKLSIYEDDGDAYPPIVFDCLNARHTHFARCTELGNTYLNKSWRANNNRVDVGNTLDIYIENYIGAQINANDIWFWIAGVAV